MSGWSALNIVDDSDSDSDIVDHTQEIQIEEALKLHQEALKHHSKHEWPEAAKAFEELFRSEIFQQDQTEDALRLKNILYLAYRGHAEFKLDYLKAVKDSLSAAEIYDTVQQCLLWFAEALSRDANDVSLWRKTAQLANILDSSRLSRFALEAVVDKDIASIFHSPGEPNPEELFASFQLRDTLLTTHDDISLSSSSFQHLIGKKLHPNVAKYVKLYPWLSIPENTAPTYDTYIPTQAVEVDSESWTAIGTALRNLYEDIGHLQIDMSNAIRPISIKVLGMDIGESDDEEEEVEPIAPKTTAVAATDNDTPMLDPESAGVDGRPSNRRRSTSTSNKRKSVAAQIDTEASNVRASKRVRQRESNAAAVAAAVVLPLSERGIVALNEQLFVTANRLFEPYNISLGTATSLRPYPKHDPTEDEQYDQFYDDFKKILHKWDDDKGNTILYGDGIKKPDENTAGVNFLETASGPISSSNKPAPLIDQALRTWLKRTNKSLLHIQQICFSFLQNLLSIPESGKAATSPTGSLYLTTTWSEELAETVEFLTDELDDLLWHHFREFREISRSNEIIDQSVRNMAAWSQSLFELALDTFLKGERQQRALELITEGDNSEQRSRVARWAGMTTDLMHIADRDESGNTRDDSLTLRFLWTTTIFAPHSGASRDLQLECLEELRALLEDLGSVVIQVPNCVSIREISTVLAEREISKIKTMDFFRNIFDSAIHSTDTTEVIEDLELILEPKIQDYNIDEEGIKGVEEMSKFLEHSNVTFKLFLWQRLGNTYTTTLDYVNAMRCRLQCIVVILSDLNNSEDDYCKNSLEQREFLILRALNLVEQYVNSAVDVGSKKSFIFDFVDPQLLVRAMQEISKLLHLLHIYASHEDAVINNEIPRSNLHSYRLITRKFQLMIVNTWTLMYFLYRASLDADTKNDDLLEKHRSCADLLSAIHQEIGIRHYCNLCDHVFLKLHLSELLRFDLDGSEMDLVQCLKCRYKFDISSDLWPLSEHNTDAEPLDREIAVRIFPFVMLLVERKKSTNGVNAQLKQSMDDLMKVIGEPFNNDPRMLYNKRQLEEYLDSHIYPRALYNSLRGDGVLNTMALRSDFADIAAKGFYFQQAVVSLMRYKYAKKTANPKIEEVDVITHLLSLNVLCGQGEHWETWYRLAQSYELMLEDDLTWSAEKINNKKDDLIKLEKRIILCYVMALATAVRDEALHASLIPSTTSKSSLYTDFGIRLYSAMRSPLEGAAFAEGPRPDRIKALDGIAPQSSLPEVPSENVYKFAILLFQRAIDDGSTDWQNYYMLGKCKARLEYEAPEVLAMYAQAITASKKTERSGEPIFEPHHKLVSATYKYWLNDELDDAEAFKWLQSTQYLPKDAICPILDSPAFNKLIIDVLSRIKSADKQKWHHRMAYRIARIQLDHFNNPTAAYNELKGFFSNKSMATVLSIWKPVNERPGRHFVFACHYLTLYIYLLLQLRDRAGLEILAKKLKKGAQTASWKHAEIWYQLVHDYAKVLRMTSEVPDSNEEKVLSTVSWDEFNTFSQKLEEYFEKLENQTHKTYEVLRDAYDLKKLNTGLAKTNIVEDLLADAYSMLYGQVVLDIIEKLASIPEVPASSANPMSLHNLMDSEPRDAANPVALAAAHARMDDHSGRAKITKITRKDVSQKINAMFKNRTAVNLTTLTTTAPKVLSIIGKQVSTPIEGSSPATYDTPMGSPSVDSPQVLSSKNGETRDEDDEGADAMDELSSAKSVDTPN